MLRHHAGSFRAADGLAAEEGRSGAVALGMLARGASGEAGAAAWLAGPRFGGRCRFWGLSQTKPSLESYTTDGA